MSQPLLLIIGGSCQSSWDLQAIGLKSGAHSPFEWHFTPSLSDVLFVMNLAANNKPIPTCRMANNADNTVEGTQITTSHYINVNYAELMERRIARMLVQIRDPEPLVFYRHDWYNNITRAEADTFAKIIRQINPDCQFKMLVASGIETESWLTDIDWLMHRQYDVGRFLEYFAELGLEKATVATVATEPEATEPEATEPEATEPEATEPEATEPEATEPEATEPEATEPEATEPEATEPEATEPEATEPEATEPEATEPEATEPEATEPEATEPEATEPEAEAEAKETEFNESPNTYVKMRYWRRRPRPRPQPMRGHLGGRQWNMLIPTG